MTDAPRCILFRPGCLHDPQHITTHRGQFVTPEELRNALVLDLAAAVKTAGTIPDSHTAMIAVRSALQLLQGALRLQVAMELHTGVVATANGPLAWAIVLENWIDANDQPVVSPVAWAVSGAQPPRGDYGGNSSPATTSLLTTADKPNRNYIGQLTLLAPGGWTDVTPTDLMQMINALSEEAGTVTQPPAVYDTVVAGAAIMMERVLHDAADHLLLVQAGEYPAAQLAIALAVLTTGDHVFLAYKDGVLVDYQPAFAHSGDDTVTVGETFLVVPLASVQHLMNGVGQPAT